MHIFIYIYIYIYACLVKKTNKKVQCFFQRSNEMLGKNTRLELHKDASCYFEYILEVEFNKTAAVWLFISHLTNNTY